MAVGLRVDTTMVLSPEMVDEANALLDWSAVHAGWYVLAVRFRAAEWCAAAALLGRPEDEDRLAQLEAGEAALLKEGHRLEGHPEREEAEREVVAALAALRLALHGARQRMRQLGAVA